MLCNDTYGPKGLMLFWPISTKFFSVNLCIFDGLMSPYGNWLPVEKLIFAFVKEIAVIGICGIILVGLDQQLKRYILAVNHT